MAWQSRSFHLHKKSVLAVSGVDDFLVNAFTNKNGLLRFAVGKANAVPDFHAGNLDHRFKLLMQPSQIC